jgi:hypothetical protein
MDDEKKPVSCVVTDDTAGASRAHVAIILCVACAVRLAYLWNYKNHPFFSFLHLDPLWHDLWAKRIAEGDWLGEEVFFRAPLYPYMLAVVYDLTGTSLVAARLWQFSSGVCSALLTYALGLKLLENRRYALGAALVFALYGPMIYFEGELLIPSLIVFLDMLALYSFHMALKRNRWKLLALSGFVFGMSCIARPNVLIPVAALAGWAAFVGEDGFGRGILKRAAAFFVAFMILPGLVTLRNGLVGGDYVFVASQSGANFFLGNNPKADGKNVRGMEAAFTEMEDDYRDSVAHSSKLIAERDLGRALKPSEVSSYWFARSFRWMQSNPGKAALLVAKKMYYMIRGHEGGSNRDIYASHEFSPVMRLLMWDKGIAFPAGLLIPLALMGMALGWRRAKPWAPFYIFILLYSGTIVVFFVNGRYRMPLVGPMILFAAFGVKSLAASVASGKWRVVIPALLLLAAMLFVSNWGEDGDYKPYERRHYMHLGAYYFDKGDLDTAEKNYLKALDVIPNSAFALHRLGLIALKRKQFPEAELYSYRAVQAKPTHPSLHVVYGAMLEGRHDLDGAIAEYREALRLDPNHDRARRNLQRALGKKSPPP